MDSWTPEKRVITTLNHEEPDRIPMHEGGIEVPELAQTKKPVRDNPGLWFMPYELTKILTKPWIQPFRKVYFKILKHPKVMDPFVKTIFNQSTQLYRKYSVDLIGYVGGIPMVFKDQLFEDFYVNGKKRRVMGPHNRLVTELPSIDTAGAVQRNGFLTGPEDYDKYMEFNPDHPGNYFLVPKIFKLAKDKIAFMFYIHGSGFFEMMSDMFGFVTLFRLMVKEKSFIKRVVKDLNEYACAVAEHLLESGARLFYLGDDLGQKGRGIISPKMYSEFFHDRIKRFTKIVHDKGGYVIRHSCGYFKEYIPFFLEEKIDAVHPWETSAGMDIFEGKQKWGDKMTVVGNVPIDMLSHGTTKEVVEYTKRLIRECGPGGGYIISSSHSIVPSVRWEKYAAMLWTLKKYGSYPIKLSN